MQTAAVLVIGNEILSGRTQDKNIAFLGQELSDLGISLKECCIIPDDEQKIIDTLNILRKKYTFVFTTGGIGPTHDDITARSVAKAFGVKCPRNAEAVAILNDYYGDNINDARLKMTEIPEGATLIQNDVSKAPGFNLENVYVFAGIPNIMQNMFSHIKPTLQKGAAPILSKSFFCHVPESIIAPGLGLIQKDYPKIIVGSYPHYEEGRPSLNVELRGTDEKMLKEASKRVEDLITSLIDKH